MKIKKDMTKEELEKWQAYPWYKKLYLNLTFLVVMTVLLILFSLLSYHELKWDWYWGWGEESERRWYHWFFGSKHGF